MAKKRSKEPAAPSKWEASFAWHWRLRQGPELATQSRLVPNRLFRFDFSHERSRVAIELDGGTFGGKSGHNTGTGIESGYEKCNAASRAGWCVLRFGSKRMQRDMIGIVDEVLAVIRERGG
jgi:very-short-patch-repair endonuclease